MAENSAEENIIRPPQQSMPGLWILPRVVTNVLKDYLPAVRAAQIIGECGV